MATAVLSSEEEQAHDSDDRNAESEEVKKKSQKSRKLAHKIGRGVVVWYVDL